MGTAAVVEGQIFADPGAGFGDTGIDPQLDRDIHRNASSCPTDTRNNSRGWVGRQFIPLAQSINWGVARDIESMIYRSYGHN